jgi:hypothetical protein
VYDLILDLDGTLGALELLAALARRDDVRIRWARTLEALAPLQLLGTCSSAPPPTPARSFFSAGEESRNGPLVERLGELVRGLGVRRWDVEVFSRQHLAATGAKDLQRLPRPFPAASALLVDDTPGVGPAGQGASQLQVGGRPGPAALPPAPAQATQLAAPHPWPVQCWPGLRCVCVCVGGGGASG